MTDRQQEGRPLRRASRLAWILIGLCLLAPCFGQQYVRAVRYWSLEQATRVAVETDGPIKYRWERLSNPDRLFFDILDAVPLVHRKRIQVIPVGDRLVKQIRVAETQPGVTRVVLDLAAAADFTVSELANPSRLVIELRPARSPAPPEKTGAQPLFTPPPATPGPRGEQLETPPRLGAAAPSKAAPPARLELANSPAPPASVPAPEPMRTPASELLKPESAPSGTGLAAQRDSRGSRSLIRALGLKVARVVIDPGHGGHDTGTIGPTGLQEKDLVLDIAKRLARLITERLGAEVVLTRTDDRFVSLEERTELANASEADLFLSIHANSSRLRGIAGVETFYLNFTTAADALEVAARENASSSRTIHELQDLVLKIAKKEKVQESREFALAVQKAVFSALRTPGLRDRGVKKAPFLVLIGAQMPAALVEIAFLSNPREEKLLKRPDYRQRIAEAICRGVAQYAGTLSHFQVARKAP